MDAREIRFDGLYVDGLTSPGSITAMEMEDVIITESKIEIVGPNSDRARCTGKFAAKADRGCFLASCINANLPDFPVLITRIGLADNGGVEGSFDFMCPTRPLR